MQELVQNAAIDPGIVRIEHGAAFRAVCDSCSRGGLKCCLTNQGNRCAATGARRVEDAYRRVRVDRRVRPQGNATKCCDHSILVAWDQTTCHPSSRSSYESVCQHSNFGLASPLTSSCKMAL